MVDLTSSPSVSQTDAAWSPSLMSTRVKSNRLSELRQAATQAKHVATACGHRQVLLLPAPADPVPPEWVEHLVRVTPDKVLRVDVAALATVLGRTRNHVLRELWGTDPHELSALLRAQHAVLVEGSTDRAVFSVLLRRWGLERYSVVTAHSKVRLAALRALAEQLGVETYVIFDGDGGPTSPSAAKAHRVRLTRQTQTAALTATLPCDGTQEHWACGDQGVVGSQWCAWQEDLEAELQQWPTFLAALRDQGSDLAAKNAGALQAAVEQASSADLPESFRRVLRTLRTARPRG